MVFQVLITEEELGISLFKRVPQKIRKIHRKKYVPEIKNM